MEKKLASVRGLKTTSVVCKTTRALFFGSLQTTSDFICEHTYTQNDVWYVCTHRTDRPTVYASFIGICILFRFFFASFFFFSFQRLPIHIRRLKRASSTVFLFRFVIRFFSSILISRGTGSFECSFQSRCLKNTWNIINIDILINRAF